MLVCFLLHFFNASLRKLDAILSSALAPHLEHMAVSVEIGSSNVVYVISTVFSEHILHGKDM
jgi:hypothetical protein